MRCDYGIKSIEVGFTKGYQWEFGRTVRLFFQLTAGGEGCENYNIFYWGCQMENWKEIDWVGEWEREIGSP